MKSGIALALTLVILIALLFACAPPAVPAPEIPTDKPFQPKVGGNSQTGSTPASRDQTITIPGAPQVTPSDVLDQIVFYGVGGGKLDCIDATRSCVESRQNGLYLVNFRPNQRVIVLMYRYHKNEWRNLYYTQWESTMNPDGSLWIEIPNLNFQASYVILDALTHTHLAASAPLEESYLNYYSGNYFACRADYTTRLRLGDQARVAYVNGTNLRLRSTPNHDSLDNVIGGIPEGTLIYLDDGPICAGGWIFWKVMYNKKIGWVSEGDGQSWLLEPIQ